MSGLRRVSSIFDNLERLVCAQRPRSGQALLGARWSFAPPMKAQRAGLCEYSLPADYASALATRSGVSIVARTGAEPIDDQLARGLIVAVDSFYLPYRPAYGRVHSARTLLVRSGATPTQVFIDDAWQPTYAGPLERAILERARRSPVPLDPLREPIFAGRPIDGEWYSVELAPLAPRDVPAWTRERLAELWRDGAASLAALRAFADELAHDDTPAMTRAASLILRAEISTRVFLCAFLRAAASWIGDLSLRHAADRYYDELAELQLARDLSTKRLAHPRRPYRAIVLACLSRAISAEARLATTLQPLTDRRPAHATLLRHDA